MNYSVISSGSHGNAVVINNCVLIDCGVSFKALKDTYKDLQLVLLTHIHSDHFKPKTLSILARERPTLRFACCEWLVNDLVNAGVNPSNIDVLKIGKIYDYRAFKVSPIKLYHNVENCGYRLYFDEKKALYATDTGHLDGITAKDYDLYLIEANYTEEDLQKRIDEKLKNGEYCYELNVANRHLSHKQASQFLLDNMGDNSKYVFLHEHIEKKEEQGEKQ